MKALVKVAKGAGNWNVIDKPEPAVGEGQVHWYLRQRSP